jgi:deoxyribodipyrimidine photo-lyase
MGVNTIRTYNPIKQSRDHDPEGLFIKQWIPALRNVPQTFIHEPWKMTDAEQVFYECIIGKNYPTPIIELSETSRKANKKLWDLKKTDHARQENQKILGTLTLRKSEIDIELKTKKTRKNNRKELDLNLKLF